MTIDCLDAAQPGQSTTIVCTFTDSSFQWIVFYRYNDACVRCVKPNGKCKTIIQGYSAVVKSAEKATLTIKSFNPKADGTHWTCVVGHALVSARQQCTKYNCTLQCEHGSLQNDTCTCACPNHWTGDKCDNCTWQCERGSLQNDTCTCAEHGNAQRMSSGYIGSLAAGIGIIVMCVTILGGQL